MKHFLSMRTEDVNRASGAEVGGCVPLLISNMFVRRSSEENVCAATEERLPKDKVLHIFGDYIGLLNNVILNY